MANFNIIEIANAGTTVPQEVLSNTGILSKYNNLLNQDNEDPLLYKTELTSYQNLTNQSYEKITASLIKTMLYLVSSLTIIALLVVGVLYLSGSFNEENLSKAKKILGYIGIGVLIISASYGVIAGILEINFF